MPSFGQGAVLIFFSIAVIIYLTKSTREGLAFEVALKLWGHPDRSVRQLVTAGYSSSSQEAGECQWSVHFLFAVQDPSQPIGIVRPMFMVVLPCSAKTS